MKQYRIGIINYKKLEGIPFKDRPKHVITKYANGMKEARSLCAAPLHYSYNCKSWYGYKDSVEYIVTEI